MNIDLLDPAPIFLCFYVVIITLTPPCHQCSATQKLGPWSLLQKAKNPNFEGPFRGPEGHENFYFLGG